MRNIPVKVDGDTLEADEFNPSQSETEDLVLSSGQTLNPSDDFQVSKAAAIYAGSGDYYNDSGTADNYILSPLADKKAPPAYYDGLKIRFKPVTTNTGVSQIKLNGLSFVPLKRLANGVAVDLVGGELVATVLCEAVYNSALDQFEVTREAISYSPSLIKVSKKLDGLIMANNGNTSIDISAGYFVDSTDTNIYHLSSTLTKNLNSTWVAGSGNGGRGDAILVNNKFYYLFMIAKTDGTVDAGFDSSPTATNLLGLATGYTKYRRIGGVYWGTTEIKPFYETLGRTFHYRDALLSFSQVPQAASSIITLGTPPDFPVMANVYFAIGGVIIETVAYEEIFYIAVGSHDDILPAPPIEGKMPTLATLSNIITTVTFTPSQTVTYKTHLPPAYANYTLLVKNGTIKVDQYPSPHFDFTNTAVDFCTNSYQEFL